MGAGVGAGGGRRSGRETGEGAGEGQALGAGAGAVLAQVLALATERARSWLAQAVWGRGGAQAQERVGQGWVQALAVPAQVLAQAQALALEQQGAMR